MSSISPEGGQTIEVDENDFMVDKTLQRVAMAGWVRNLMKTEGNCSSPLDIDSKNSENISLPPLEWYNYEEKAMVMKIKNSGNTVIVKGEWENERPFLTGGPFKGCYVFSQAHFHWGPTDGDGSEHSFMGDRFAMEMHAVFFKAIYRTQLNAIRNKDGIANLAYFFELGEIGNKHLRPILQMLPKICKPMSTTEIEPLSLSDLGIKDFNSMYYFYYGSMGAEDTSFPAMWFLWPIPSLISTSQVGLFRNILSSQGGFLRGNSKAPLPAEKGKNLFYVSDPSHDGQLEEEDVAIESDSKSGKKAAPVISKTLRKKRKGPLKTFLSFFSKSKKERKTKRKWFTSCVHQKKKGNKLQTADNINPVEFTEVKKRGRKKIKREEKDAGRNRAKSEDTLGDEGEYQKALKVPPLSREDEIVKMTPSNEDEELTNEKKKKKGIYVDVYEWRSGELFRDGKTNKLTGAPIQNLLEENDRVSNETQLSLAKMKGENMIETRRSPRTMCNELDLENRLWIEKYNSNDDICGHTRCMHGNMAVADNSGIKIISKLPFQCNFSSHLKLKQFSPYLIGDSTLKTYGNLLPEAKKDLLQVDNYRSARGPIKRVPDLRKILEFCRSNPDELLSVTICIRNRSKEGFSWTAFKTEGSAAVHRAGIDTYPPKFAFKCNHTSTKLNLLSPLMNGDSEFKNCQNLFSKTSNDSFKALIERDDNSSGENETEHFREYDGRGGTSRKVPGLKEILELCRSNPDELLCVTICVRDTRRIKMQRKQAQRKYYKGKNWKNRSYNISLLPRMNKMPIIPEED